MRVRAGTDALNVGYEVYRIRTQTTGQGGKVEAGYDVDRHDRRETERSESLTYEEILQRDKVGLDIFRLKDESLEDSADLPPPEVLAREIAENLEAALQQFSIIHEALNTR